MRLVSYRDATGGGAVRLGAVLGEAELVDLRAALAAVLAAAGGEADRSAEVVPSDMTAFLALGEASLVAAARALAFAAAPGREALRRPLAGVELLAPVPRPGKIIGVGRNYGEHAREVGGPKQEAPRIFFKPASAVAPPGCAVRIPASVRKPDWEVELGVVIGRAARDVPEARALEYVAGYTVLDDVSAREFQFDIAPPQTSFAKGMDGFCPMGPWLATPEEVGEPWALRRALLPERRDGAGREHARHDLPGGDADRLSQPVHDARTGRRHRHRHAGRRRRVPRSAALAALRRPPPHGGGARRRPRTLDRLSGRPGPTPPPEGAMDENAGRRMPPRRGQFAARGL